jgi:hypothetical protein
VTVGLTTVPRRKVYEITTSNDDNSAVCHVSRRSEVGHTSGTVVGGVGLAQMALLVNAGIGSD